MPRRTCRRQPRRARCLRSPARSRPRARRPCICRRCRPCRHCRRCDSHHPWHRPHGRGSRCSRRSASSTPRRRRSRRTARRSHRRRRWRWCSSTRRCGCSFRRRRPTPRSSSTPRLREGCCLLQAPHALGPLPGQPPSLFFLRCRIPWVPFTTDFSLSGWPFDSVHSVRRPPLRRSFSLLVHPRSSPVATLSQRCAHCSAHCCYSSSSLPPSAGPPFSRGSIYNVVVHPTPRSCHTKPNRPLGRCRPRHPTRTARSGSVPP